MQTERKTHREVPAERRASEHLANERTFLAWARTSIAFISLGFVFARLSFVLARLGPWLHQEAGVRSHALTGEALPLGIGMACFGALLTLLAAWRYDAVNREIEAGMVKTDRVLVWFVAVVIAFLSACLIFYMLLMR